MRLRSLAISVFFLFVLLSAPAQLTPTAVTRDPQAVSILVQSLSTAGGMSAVAAIRDFTGTGNIAYNWAGTSVDAQATVAVQGVVGVAEVRVVEDAEELGSKTKPREVLAGN